MIWHSLICFSLFAALTEAATVSGTVELRDSHVASVSKKKDFSGVVISAVRVDAPPTAPPTGHAVMLQKGKMFMPHILAITTGSAVDFPNSDPIFHNAFSSYDGQIFDVGLYPPGSSKSVRFARPGVVRVFCNIHPTMSAIILVFNTPYFAQTATDGSFQLDLPPGEYDLSVFHERATEQALAGLTRRIVVTDQSVRLPPITVSEAGWLLAAHKNKYGGDYTSPPDDRVFYPGVRN
jgi:plastocyanin